MKITRTIEAEVTFEVSFQEACKVVLARMDHETCDEYESLIDQILIEGYSTEKRIPIVDLMKDEVLAKIKEEFSLEKIEQLYESYR